MIRKKQIKDKLGAPSGRRNSFLNAKGGLDLDEKFPGIDFMPYKTTEELREFNKKNDIKLLKLWEYLRRRNYKKIQKETVLKNVKVNS